MATRILACALLVLISNREIIAQSPHVSPQIQVAGEPNGAPHVLQRNEKTQNPDKSELIAQFEAQIQANPDDVLARTALSDLYSQTGQNDKNLEQSIWLIQHHPESTILSPSALGGPGAKFALANYQQLKIAWEGALADHPSDPQVLYCGGLFFRELELDRGRALELFSHARQLQPANSMYLEAVARVYKEAIVTNRPDHRPNSAYEELMSRLRTELPNATDAALLNQVGSSLAQNDNPNRQLGLQFIERAITLEPDNPRWKVALETAKNPIVTPKILTPPNAVRMDNDVAEANLIKKVEPVYPSLAESARISGSVEFTAVIGTDGRIQSLQLVRGHPLLVRAGREAVLQYVYKPTLLNGNPVPMVTNIVIPFELPQQ